MCEKPFTAVLEIFKKHYDLCFFCWSSFYTERESTHTATQGEYAPDGGLLVKYKKRFLNFAKL